MVEYNENVDIQLTAYDGYAGDVQPTVQDVTFSIYTDQNAEYNDLLADNVDVMTQPPESSLAGEQYKADLGDRFIEREHWASSRRSPTDRVDPRFPARPAQGSVDGDRP